MGPGCTCYATLAIGMVGGVGGGVLQPLHHVVPLDEEADMVWEAALWCTDCGRQQLRSARREQLRATRHTRHWHRLEHHRSRVHITTTGTTSWSAMKGLTNLQGWRHEPRADH